MEDGDALKTGRRLHRQNSVDTASTVAERSKHAERPVGRLVTPALPSKADAAGHDATGSDSFPGNRLAKTKGSRTTTDLVVFDLRSQNELLKERLIELVAEGSGDKAEIERLRSELDYAISRKKFREQEVRSHAYRIEVLKGELEKTESKLRVSQRELRSSERTRIALQNSASWRITRPLRTLKTIVGRLFLAAFGPRYSRSNSISRQPAAIPHAVSAATVKAEAGAGSVRSQNAWLEDTPALTQDIELIRASGLFDDRYYSTMYSDRIARGEDPLTHFCRVGWRQKLDPSGRCVVAGYLAANPLVAKSDENPLVHYLKSLGGLGLAAPKYVENWRVWCGRPHGRVHGDRRIL